MAISAEAAFNIFGITARGGDASFNVTPWTVVADIFGRAQDSGTWQTWARNLGLVTQKPVTTPQTGAGAVLAALNTANRASAIGIIALNDIVPTAGVAPKVRPLAFKARGQDFAYYPSSTSTSSDMINVRDGHYQTWANLHFFARKDTAGDYSAPVKTVLGLLEGKEAVSAVTKIRAVPKCAMQVSRDADGGDFKSYAPAKPCGCFFEAEASGTAPTTCKTCADDTTCGATGSRASLDIARPSNMNSRNTILFALAALAIGAASVVACDDGAATSNGTSSGNPLNPGTDAGGPGPGTDGGGPGPGTDGGACPNKPAGCFCGTPTTQKEFLNRCTNAAALPVTLTPKAATTADIP